MRPGVECNGWAMLRDGGGGNLKMVGEMKRTEENNHIYNNDAVARWKKRMEEGWSISSSERHMSTGIHTGKK